MYKIQVYYDMDCRDEAVKIAAFRLGISPPDVDEIWSNRRFILKTNDGIPVELLQAIEVTDTPDENSPDYYQSQSIFTEVFDGNELWFPLGWDPALIAGIQMSNIFEITPCKMVVQTYFYC